MAEFKPFESGNENCMCSASGMVFTFLLVSMHYRIAWVQSSKSETLDFESVNGLFVISFLWKFWNKMISWMIEVITEFKPH